MKIFNPLLLLRFDIYADKDGLTAYTGATTGEPEESDEKDIDDIRGSPLACRLRHLPEMARGGLSTAPRRDTGLQHG